jgi:hypothetical protein
MLVKRIVLAVLVSCALLACGGGASAPAPVGKQDPLPDPQQPEPVSENPLPNKEEPRIGVEEPAVNSNDPVPPGGGEGGASADDD